MCKINLFITQCNLTPDLTNKVFLITGGTYGIGQATIRYLAKLNAKIIFTGRSKDQGKILSAEITIDNPDAYIHYIPCDHSSIKSVKEVCEKIKEKYSVIDCIINNVGCFENSIITDEGYQYMLAVNY